MSFFNRDRLIGLFCFLFAGYVWYEAGTFPTSDFDAVGPSLYPRFLATVIGAASLVIFIKAKAGKAKDSKPHSGALLYVIALACGYVALLDPLGFIPTTILFLLGMILRFDPSELKVRVRNALLYAVLLSVFLFLFFNKLLGVLLPNGVLSGLLG